MRAAIVLTVLFGVLHLWALFQGVSNLLAAPAAFAQFGVSVPWWLLILGIVAPVITFTAAVLLGRKRVVTHRVALLLVSLATSNALVFSVSEFAVLLLAFQAG